VSPRIPIPREVDQQPLVSIGVKGELPGVNLEPGTAYYMRITGIQVLCVFAALTIAPSRAHTQTFGVLYNFGTLSGDPSNPGSNGVITQGRDGNLYSSSFGGAGSVFQMTPRGRLTVLYSFNGTGPGTMSRSGLTLGRDGSFYGTTSAGGYSDLGTLFKISPSGALTILYDFDGVTEGGAPTAPPIQATDGNFYGTTYIGGTTSSYGAVYKFNPPSGRLTTLYTFDSVHGANPFGPVVQAADGNLFGTTYAGGSNNDGTVFKITLSGELTVLFNFDGVHGSAPYAGLVQGNDGNFYGTTYSGGSADYGVVFKITATGAITVLHNFAGDPDGKYPYAGLVQASDGNFYGVTSQGGIYGYNGYFGTIYKITPAGVLSNIFNFDGATGESPAVTPTQSTNGLLYGDTMYGGSGILCTCGVFYRLNLGLPPFVRLLSSQGKVGNTIQVLGQGFTGTTGVSFNGSAAAFKTVSDTFLTATVPSGAITGAVTVNTPGGTLTSNENFRVTPSIAAFSPGSGTVGTSVTITGASLTQTGKITFGGVAAGNFNINSEAEVTATVPPHAKTGRIIVTTAGGTATSSTAFTVTP
jgi:uncharacterized repeat protein (TIGR03803 family)